MELCLKTTKSDVEILYRYIMLRKEKDFNKYEKQYSLFRFQVQSLYSGIMVSDTNKCYSNPTSIKRVVGKFPLWNSHFKSIYIYIHLWQPKSETE